MDGILGFQPFATAIKIGKAASTASQSSFCHQRAVDGPGDG
jgi:hypothetical protein